MADTTQWERLPAGTWSPRNPNEFHNCDLHIAYHEGIRVAAHKTRDGKRWMARATCGEYEAAIFLCRTRKEAFWRAVDAIKRAMNERG